MPVGVGVGASTMPPSVPAGPQCASAATDEARTPPVRTPGGPSLGGLSGLLRACRRAPAALDDASRFTPPVVWRCVRRHRCPRPLTSASSRRARRSWRTVPLPAARSQGGSPRRPGGRAFQPPTHPGERVLEDLGAGGVACVPGTGRAAGPHLGDLCAGLPAVLARVLVADPADPVVQVGDLVLVEVRQC